VRLSTAGLKLALEALGVGDFEGRLSALETQLGLRDDGRAAGRGGRVVLAVKFFSFLTRINPDPQVIAAMIQATANQPQD
jgi:hypothetical protein